MSRFKPNDPSTYPMPITVRPDGLEVSYPGFSRDDFFNKSGVLRPDKLDKLLEPARALVWNFTQTSHGMDYSTSAVFVLSISITINPELHLMTVGKRSFPFTIEAILTGPQRSSFRIEHSLYKTGDRSKKLMTCSSVLVYVSLALRRPIPVPVTFKRTAEGRRKPQERVQIPEIPASAFRYELEVQPRHIDSNQHTNQASYGLFCCDAAAVAAERSFYRGIQTIAELPILEKFTLFLGESVEGAGLVIATWQDNTVEDIIHFVVTLKETFILYSRWKLGDFISKPKL